MFMVTSCCMFMHKKIYLLMYVSLRALELINCVALQNLGFYILIRQLVLKYMVNV